MCYAKNRFIWVLIILLAPTAWSGLGDKSLPAKSGIRVEVRFSVKEFDPTNPKEGYLECVVHNGTDKPIKVPTSYANGFDSDIIVFGRVGKDKKKTEDVSYWWDMRLVCKDLKAKATTFAVVEPGKEIVVFKESLNELLIERAKSGWDWQA